MPNHVTTKCLVSGPSGDVARFYSEFLADDNNGRFDRRLFDFEKIIPSPPEVQGTESSTVAEKGLWAHRGVSSGFGRKKAQEMSWDAWWRQWSNAAPPSGVSTREEYLEWLKINEPETYAVGLRSAQCYDATGYSDWYGWNVNNWGTKWSAYEVVVEVYDALAGNIIFKFDTAWSFPEPIFHKLRELYPTLSFLTASFDEGWIFASEGAFTPTVTYYEEFKPGAPSNAERCRQVHMKVYGTFPEDADNE